MENLTSFSERDSANWNLSSDEVQRRRVIFWEMFTHDAWSVSQRHTLYLSKLTVEQSVVNGRPPSLNIQQTDCRFPEDLEPYTSPSGEKEPGCQLYCLHSSRTI